MNDESINSALLKLHKETMRHSRDGLEHVEALLGMRGVDVPTYTRSLPINGAFKGRMSRMVLAALKEGHRTPENIAITLKADQVSYKKMYQRVYQALLRLQRKGLVVKAGEVWGLAP